MKNSIPGAHYTSFRKLFRPFSNEGPIHFSIPEYQRSYDWQKEQRRDLFDDLERLDKIQRESGGDIAGENLSPASHFCGTIICTPENPSNMQFDVVDGQQRLTTLVMLDAMLARRVGAQPCVIENNKVLFSPQGGDHGYFKQTVLPDGIGGTQKATQAQQNYADAKNEIDQWITSLASRPEPALERMLRIVEERLHFILFILADTNEVSKVFETINNRGKPLTQMDLVKNHLIYMKAVHGWDDDVNATWQAIQHTTLSTHMRGGESVDTVLRAVVNAMFRPGKRKSGETDYKIVKEHIGRVDDESNFTKFLSFLKSAFMTFQQLRASNTTDPQKPIETQLTYLNHHPQIAGVLPLIFARQWVRPDGDAEANVLEAIEKANFRLYGLPNAASRSDSYNVVLNNLAHAFLSRIPVGNSTEKMTVITGGKTVQSSCIIEMLTGIVSAQHKDGLHQIVAGLTLDDDEGDDFYQWDALRYFLARWEESLLANQSFDFGRLMKPFHGSKSNDYLAREHIIPLESPDSITGYRDCQQLRRLGNFMLLPQGVNVALYNKPLEAKLDVLKKKSSATVLLIQNGQLGDFAEKAKEFRKHLERRSRNDTLFGNLGKRGFNQRTIDKEGELVTIKTLCDLREEEMISFALRAWRMPGESSVGTSFCGVFSFSTHGEAYKREQELMADAKPNANYLLGTAGQKLQHSRPTRRNEIVGSKFEPVCWS